MQLCLIDTSSWVEAFQQNGDAVVRKRVANALTEERACTCDIILLELWNGARGERERGELEKLEGGLTLLPTDDRTWRTARELATTCRAGGVTVPVTHLIVLACAKRHETALEHSDDHFNLIKRAISESVDRSR